ncbi:helix-turn-helix domain-containing protein [Levilactobacillus suantsaii]|uniref:helix-turn-helix domain-containing protein n=1 Tax=Levilactobacillus suantsaii TaxID=2292255 RepID=UPI001F24F828|nr:helix-turn-helix domain-containing protein [Levilactobacillus suantsaii]
MKKLYLTPSHNDYQDYLQEGRLLFPQIYARFPENPREKPHQFLAYAQQKLYWELLDRLRRDRRLLTHQAEGDHEQLLSAVADDQVDPHILVAQRLLEARLLKLIRETGSIGEWQYLMGTLKQQLSIAEIAAQCRVSRQTVYGWRKHLANRLKRVNFWGK